MSQQINLFNPLFLKQKKHFSASTIVQATGVLVVAMVAFYFYALLQVNNLELRAGEVAKQQAQQQERLARLTAQVGGVKHDPLEDEVKSVRAVLSERQALADSIGASALGSTKGYSEYMRALARQSVGGLWLTGFRINEDGAEVAVAGRAQFADLVPVFIRKLASEPVMRGRSFEGLAMASVMQGIVVRDAARGSAPESVPVVEFNFGTSQSAIEALRPVPPAEAVAQAQAQPTSTEPAPTPAQAPTGPVGAKK